MLHTRNEAARTNVMCMHECLAVRSAARAPVWCAPPGMGWLVSVIEHEPVGLAPNFFVPQNPTNPIYPTMCRLALYVQPFVSYAVWFNFCCLINQFLPNKPNKTFVNTTSWYISGFAMPRAIKRAFNHLRTTSGWSNMHVSAKTGSRPVEPEPDRIFKKLKK